MQEQITTAQKILNTIIEYCVQYSFQVLGALIVLAAGFAAASWVASILLRLFEKKKMDVTFAQFIANCAKLMVIGFAVIIALGKFGITIAPFIAALSAMAFGASFAIQGPLSNYGAGLSIILSRPFVVGNTISVSGVSGVVKEVKLACTVLITEDGVKVTIPNKDIVGQIIHNSLEYKIVEAEVGISYSSKPEKAIEVIQSILASDPDVADSPKPQVGIASFGDSSVNIGYRYWVPTTKYYPVLYAVNLAVYSALGQSGITIPFPQREVRVLQGASASLI